MSLLRPIRAPGRPTEHRPVREGEIDGWLSTLEVRVSSDERTRLLERIRALTASWVGTAPAHVAAPARARALSRTVDRVRPVLRNDAAAVDR